MVLAPVVRGRKGEYGKMFKDLAEDGYARVRVDGELYELPVDLGLDKNYKHDIEVVVDRLVIREGIERRLTDSIETALKLAEGLVLIETVEKTVAERASRCSSRRASPAPTAGRPSRRYSRGRSRSTARTGPATAATGWAAGWR
jgi:excinuclease ABC subunit A